MRNLQLSFVVGFPKLAALVADPIHGAHQFDTDILGSSMQTTNTAIAADANTIYPSGRIW